MGTIGTFETSAIKKHLLCLSLAIQCVLSLQFLYLQCFWLDFFSFNSVLAILSHLKVTGSNRANTYKKKTKGLLPAVLKGCRRYVFNLLLSIFINAIIASILITNYLLV